MVNKCCRAALMLRYEGGEIPFGHSDLLNGIILLMRCWLRLFERVRYPVHEIPIMVHQLKDWGCVMVHAEMGQ